MKLADLVGDPPPGFEPLAAPEVDPLVLADGLQEAELLKVSFDALHLTVGLLFDLRCALQLRQGNTGLLLVEGARDFTWSGPERPTAATAWTVGGSEPAVGADGFRLRFGMWPAPGAQLSVSGASALFVAGDVPLPHPVDYGDATRTERQLATAGWHSDLQPLVWSTTRVHSP